MAGFWRRLFRRKPKWNEVMWQELLASTDPRVRRQVKLPSKVVVMPMRGEEEPPLELKNEVKDMTMAGWIKRLN